MDCKTQVISTRLPYSFEVFCTLVSTLDSTSTIDIRAGFGPEQTCSNVVRYCMVPCNYLHQPRLYSLDYHCFGKYALSSGVLSYSHANQSLLVVGSSPIALTFHIPRPSNKQFISTYTAFTPSICVLVFSDSSLANVALVPAIACSGPLNLGTYQ